MRSHGSSLWGFPNNIFQGWFKMKTTSIFPVHGLEAWIYNSTVYGYFTEANCKNLNKIFVCCFYNITNSHNERK